MPSQPVAYAQPVENMPYCEFCGGRHEYMNGAGQPPILCGYCRACWKYCQHLNQCSWPDDTPKVVDDKPVIVPRIVENLAIHNLREAFEAWYVTSVVNGSTTSPENAWLEFENFAKEQLTPVEQDKRYLQITLENGKVKEFQLLDATNLFRNQDGAFVVVEGKRRNRIGKDVAVMP